MNFLLIVNSWNKTITRSDSNNLIGKNDFWDGLIDFDITLFSINLSQSINPLKIFTK